MRKFIALILGVVFVMGFAASAFAIHAAIPAETTAVGSLKDVQIRLGGEIRTRGWLESNISNSTGTARAATGYPYDLESGTFSWYDQRYRLLLDVKSGDNLSGRLMLESGNSATSDVHVWGSDVSTVGGAKNSTLDRVLEGWIAYTGSGLLGMPAGIKIGHMPTVIGVGTFYDHRRFGDDAILLYLEPMKGTEINLLMAKISEGVIATTSTTTIEVAGDGIGDDNGVCDPSLPEACVTISSTSTSVSTTDNTDDTDLYSLMFNHSVDKDTKVGLNYSYMNNSDLGMKFQNLGVDVKGMVADAGIGYRASADLQFGKLLDTDTAELKAKGYAFTAGLDYKLDPVTLRASLAYGSGDSDPTDDKVKTFQTAVSNVINYTVVYEYRVATACGAIGTGICNTTYLNLGVDASPIKDMKLALDYYLLRASKKLSDTDDTLGNKKDIGSEVDFKLTYKLAKNLTYFINSGVLFAGDFYKNAPSGPASDPETAVVFHHGLTLSF